MQWMAQEAMDQSKLPQEFKVAMVHKYIANNFSCSKIARVFGIPNDSVIVQWVSRYNSGKLLKFTRGHSNERWMKAKHIEIAQ